MESQQYDIAERLFGRFDPERTGYLNHDQIKEMLQSTYSNKDVISDRDVEDFIKQVEAQREDRISLEEYKEYLIKSLKFHGFQVQENCDGFDSIRDEFMTESQRTPGKPLQQQQQSQLYHSQNENPHYNEPQQNNDSYRQQPQSQQNQSQQYPQQNQSYRSQQQPQQNQSYRSQQQPQQNQSYRSQQQPQQNQSYRSQQQPQQNYQQEPVQQQSIKLSQSQRIPDQEQQQPSYGQQRYDNGYDGGDYTDQEQNRESQDPYTLGDNQNMSPPRPGQGGYLDTQNYRPRQKQQGKPQAGQLSPTKPGEGGYLDTNNYQRKSKPEDFDEMPRRVINVERQDEGSQFQPQQEYPQQENSLHQSHQQQSQRYQQPQQQSNNNSIHQSRPQQQSQQQSQRYQQPQQIQDNNSIHQSRQQYQNPQNSYQNYQQQPQQDQQQYDLNRSVSKQSDQEIVQSELDVAEKLFGRYDIDKSGYLERNEVRELLCSAYADNTIINNRDVDQFIKMIDTNNDGRLSLEEYKQFVIRSLKNHGFAVEENCEGFGTIRDDFISQSQRSPRKGGRGGAY